MWPGVEDEEPAKPGGWGKSKYWSDVCKDIGKYVLIGSVIAPFFGIGGATVSWVFGALGLLAGAYILYAGSKLDPGS